MLEYPCPDCPDFNVVDADRVLEVAVAGQPGDEGRGAGDATGLDAGWAQWCVSPDDHGAGRVLGSLTVHEH